MPEKYVRYAEDVDTLTEAWTFVLGHVDEFTRPNIQIRPTWVYENGSRDGRAGFAAKVYGTVND